MWMRRISTSDWHKHYRDLNGNLLQRLGNFTRFSNLKRPEGSISTHSSLAVCLQMLNPSTSATQTKTSREQTGRENDEPCHLET